MVRLSLVATAAQTSTNSGSQSQSNTLPQADRYSYLRLSRLSSCAVIEFPRIELFLGLDQGNQQQLISTASGSPSEARDLVGSP
jgi:hypothetical protein